MKSKQLNSKGFFDTQPISSESLLTGILCFNWQLDDFPVMSDEELNISERLMQGKRAERYFSEWLKRSEAYELMAENIQIIDDKQTLGEFDFIVKRLQDGQLIHVELVHKYYLFDPEAKGTEFEHWIGPNRGDQLDFKLDKLRSHQFPLLQTQPARKRLAELGLNVDEMEQQLLFLANLFVPTEGEAVFEKVNPNGVEGTWMRLVEWQDKADSDDLFSIPEKKDWFSRNLATTEWYPKKIAQQKIKELHEQKRSPLVYAKNEFGEQRRDFIVWW
ncbi:MAG: hypothetical protein CSA03_00960 [Bacteroidetes bacterium]|nr:MAG: hypothetical protein CSA03_00960 [Bacteroidota bacterium]